MRIQRNEMGKKKKKLPECITLASNWEHGHREVKELSCLMQCSGNTTYSQLQSHAELIMCKEVWLPNLAMKKKEQIQGITHHSDSVFNFSTGCDTWRVKTEAQGLKRRAAYGSAVNSGKKSLSGVRIRGCKSLHIYSFLYRYDNEPPPQQMGRLWHS